MEQASIDRKEHLRISRPFLGVASFVGAILLVVVMLTSMSDAGRFDRVMTDEAKNIKTGYIVPGDPKPHGGLPELSQQVDAGDFAAAQKTLSGISGKFASVKAEVLRRNKGGPADGQFAAAMAQLSSSLDAKDQPAAQKTVREATGIWPQAESELSQTQIGRATAGKTLGTFILAWALFTLGLVVLWERGKAGKSDEPSPDQHGSGVNLTRVQPIRALLASPLFPASLQGLGLVLLLMVLVSGLMGASNAESMATVLTWSLWWSPLMIISLVLLGKLWCGACPLGAITAVIERFGAGGMSPTYARKYRLGILVMTPLLISITLFTLMRAELFGYIGVATAAPAWTVVYFGIWIVPAVSVSLVYKRRAWCRYWCPAGAVTSVTAKLSPLEIAHSRSTGVQNCSTMEYPGKYLSSDKRCIYCMKCTQAYPDAPVRMRLRLPGSAAIREKHIFAEAAMAIILVAVFPINHGLGQLDLFKSGLANQVHLSYFIAVLATLAAYAGVSLAGARLANEKFHDHFARFGVAYAPIGIMFSLGQGITGILGKSGAILNAVMPFFGVHGYWNPMIISSSSYMSVQMWMMSWMAFIGGMGSLVLIWALAKKSRLSAPAWMPHIALVTGTIILAKILPMPMN